MNLFIARLNPSTKTQDLHKLFTHYGLVTTVKVIFDHSTGKSKCYGFVEMPNNNEAHEALQELDNTTFQENLISVRESQPQDDRGMPAEVRRATGTPSWKDNDRQQLRGTSTVIVKPLRDDLSRRNFGYRGSNYHGSV